MLAGPFTASGIRRIGYGYGGIENLENSRENREGRGEMARFA